MRGFVTAIWKDGPLEFNKDSKNYERNSNKKVALKYLYNSLNTSNEFFNNV
jgi:hypothetical protein